MHHPVKKPTALFVSAMYRIPDIGSRLLRPWVMLNMPRQKLPWVYLTFDDGPNPQITPEILTLLRSYQAKATFFPTGADAAAYPDMISKIREEGHSIHLHSWSHQRKLLRSFQHFRMEMIMSYNLIDSRLYRPPYGRLSIRQWFWLRRNHFSSILWNVSFRDFSDDELSEDKMLKLIGKIKPGDVILLHNNLNFKKKTLYYTEWVLKELKKNALIFERIL
jgi:peptidoglycan-N-acetylglucosamine deacetylase